MKANELFEQNQSYSLVEGMIVANLEEVREQEQFFHMSADFLLNALSLGKRDARESSIIVKHVLELEKESFSRITAYSYYLAALEFWSYAQEQEKELDDIVANVKAEVKRYKDVLCAYLVEVLSEEAFVHQVEVLQKSFTVREEFHKSLQDYISQYQLEVTKSVLEKLGQ